ncbi:MAG TPA: ribonuclease HII [Acidimicrobiales bacterium]|nr:ribonuclease HII [Acidimicrobiales bacterium]
MRSLGRAARYGHPPSLAFERHAWAAGHELVVGMDEVGRGAWAGPIMVGAAMVPRERRVYGVRDSKMLPEGRREALFDRIAAWCPAWAVGEATQVECDALGMAEAQRLAARRALGDLGVVPDMVLIDGKWDFAGTGNTLRIVKGDAYCLSIAAASMLAKVTRDRYMREIAPNFPQYEFQDNKGYPCWRHKMALQAYGPSTVHRRTWVFMDALSWDMRVRRTGPPGAAEAVETYDEQYETQPDQYEPAGEDE